MLHAECLSGRTRNRRGEFDARMSKASACRKGSLWKDTRTRLSMFMKLPPHPPDPPPLTTGPSHGYWQILTDIRQILTNIVKILRNIDLCQKGMSIKNRTAATCSAVNRAWGDKGSPFKQGASFSRNEKSACGRLFSRKWGLGLPIHIKMLFVLINIRH